jgi:DNA-binding response OmpR family regulator
MTLQSGKPPVVVVVGLDKEPTASLLADLQRLQYTADLLPWPVPRIPLRERLPVAVIVDFRALGVMAEAACRAVLEDRALGKVPLIALVPEQEGPRVDLSLGFEDLLLAPYRLTDLAARLRLIRWRSDAPADPDLIRAGALTLNPVTYEVFVGRQPIELTLKEYQLLLFLLKNSGRVFTREQLLDHVWGADYFGGTRTVDVHIRRLRAKTEEAGELLETVRGVGYRVVVGENS